MRLVVVVFCLLGVILSVVNGLETLKVSVPRYLADQYPDGIPERPALFGRPSFATSLQGRVARGNPQDLDGCAPLNRTFIMSQLGRYTGPFILLLDRGTCTFVTKVRNAESIGAIAAIIVDNVDEAGLPFMADDGTGRNINIPSALIHRNDGQRLKDALTNTSTGSILSVTMSWSLPRPDNRVEFDLWSNPIDEYSRPFRNVFGTAALAFGEHAKFTPRYFIIDGDDYACRSPGLPCGNQCTNEGRYCSIDPDHDLYSGKSGQDVIIESLTQMCIFRYLNNTQPATDYKWWTYQQCFQSICYPLPPPAEAINWNDTCRARCAQQIGVPQSIITQCITESGGLETGENSLLEEELRWRQIYGVWFPATLIVNYTPYRGSLVCAEPLTEEECGPLGMICEGYEIGTKPLACYSSPGCGPAQFKDVCGVCGGNNATCLRCDGIARGPDVTGPTQDIRGQCCWASDKDCSGICWGTQVKDCSGICGGTKTKDKNNACCLISERDCDESCAGAKKTDACSQCLAPNDPSYMPIGKGNLDACGYCFRYDDAKYNQSCLGCDGVPASGKQRDACGTCGGPITDKSGCPDSGSGVGVGTIVGISVGCVALAGLGVFFYMRRQQNVLKNDIDSLLKQYLPLDAANSLAHPSTAAQDNLMPESSSRNPSDL